MTSKKKTSASTTPGKRFFLSVVLALSATASYSQWNSSTINTFTTNSNVGIGLGPANDARLQILNFQNNRPGTDPLNTIPAILVQRNLIFPLVNGIPIANIMEIKKQDYNDMPGVPFGPAGPNELRFAIDGEGFVGIGKQPLKPLDVGGDANIDHDLKIGNDTKIGNILEVNGPATLNSQLSVLGSTTLMSTLTIWPLATGIGGAYKLPVLDNLGMIKSQNFPTLSITGGNLTLSNGGSINSTIVLPTASGADNLGNHVATTNLNMSNKDIIAVKLLKFQNASQWMQGNATNNSISFSGAVGVGGAVPFSPYTSLEVNGNVVTSGTITSSDRRYKKNFGTVSDLTSKLLSLVPFQYNYRKEEFKDKNFDDNLHFGLIAQEVKEVLPNVVYVIDSEGHMGINYVELIPLLIQTAKDQNEKINTLEKELKILQNLKVPNTQFNEANTHKESILYQNVPNPFNKETVIKFDIREPFSNAYIGIYDLNGRELKKLKIETASGEVLVNNQYLQSGMYIYSLIVNGKVIDSKKMVMGSN